jgi:hypothetical protein
MKFVEDYVQIGGLMLRSLFLLLSLLCLTACSYFSQTGKDVKYVKDPFNPNRMLTEKEAKKIGTLDLNFIKKDDKPDGYQEKNYFLWSACVDVLSGLPPKISDAAGGIYTTEYVKAQNGTKQSIQCRVVGDKVLSDNINVTVFTIKPDGTQLAPYENNELKSNVLIRAKELKAQYDDTV